MKMSTAMETDAEKDDTAVTTSDGKQDQSEIDNEQKTKQEEIADFDIPGSDTENEDKTEKLENGKSKDRGFWEPPTNVIVELYEKLDKEGILELDWKCPKRKTLEDEEKETDEAIASQSKQEEKNVVDETKEEEPTEFDDFDEFTAVNRTASVTPRRTMGSAGREGKGSSKKRVAILDKVFTDMIRHKKMDEQGKQLPEDEKDSTQSDSTPHRTLGRQFRMRHRDFLK
ncbi:PAXIP1-associated glutamate-rich protein 1A-like [Glandiceps talaboti]